VRTAGFISLCILAGLGLVHGLALRLPVLIFLYLVLAILGGIIFRVVRWSEVSSLFRSS
jgi:hypothetical protein